VKRVGDIALLVVQWGMVLLGLYLVVVSLHLYSIETNWAGSLPQPTTGQDTYILPSWQRLIGGMTTAFIALGQGALLFYLRRIFLSRHQ
jgi:hypothetical protein